MTLFRITLPICIAVAAWGIIMPDSLATAGQTFTSTMFDALDWFFMGSVTAFLLISIGLGFSKYGRLRLGGPDSRPDFSTASWLSMLFAAGIGSGLLFWGVAEPITHFSNPPMGTAGSPAAARQAMLITNFHWGLHAWAVYGMAALTLGYFGLRRGTPYLAGAPIRAGYTGRWVEPVALAADLIAVLAVAFGVAGALVFGTSQLQAGLAATVGISGDSMAVGMGLLAVVTVAFLISATTSLDKGIKLLSNINIVLALALMIFLLVVGPTSFLMRGFVNALGDYVSHLPSMTLQLYPFNELGVWLQSWTLNYFVWWIAWAPFVGIFIARISRGRTIREFVFGVIVTPSVLSVFWFAVFGGTGLYEELSGSGGVAAMVNDNVTVALFSLFERLPAAQLLNGVTVVLIFVFLITSADSATFVLGMLTSQGSFDPPTRRKVAWGVALGGVSGGLMLSGSIDAIRALSIVGAIPFTFVMVLQVVALLRTLPGDYANSEKS